MPSFDIAPRWARIDLFPPGAIPVSSRAVSGSKAYNWRWGERTTGCYKCLGGFRVRICLELRGVQPTITT